MATRGLSQVDGVFKTLSALVNYKGSWKLNQVVRVDTTSSSSYWQATGNIITPSQTPSLTGAATLSDANGNEFSLLIKGGGFNFQDLGVVGDGVADDYLPTLAVLNTASSTGAVARAEGLVIRSTGKLIVKDNTHIRAKTSVFVKAYDSVEAVKDALFTNESYGVLGAPNENITIDGLNIMDDPATTTGSFISFNWINGLTLKNLNFVKSSIGWSAHICAKNVNIDNVFIDSLQSPANGDGLHFEYLEDALVTDVIANCQDDCIALQYQPSFNSSVGPNLKSKNIVITNSVLSSSIANGIRLGAGELGNVPNSDTVVSNAQYSKVTFSDIIINKLGASGTSIALYDERTNSAFPHEDIVFDNVILADSTSVAGQVIVQGNQDPTDVANINTKNYKNIVFNIKCKKSSGGLWNLGGAESIKLDGVELEQTLANATTVSVRQLGRFEIASGVYKSLATSRIFLLRDVEFFKTQGASYDLPSPSTAAIQMENPNTTTADIIIKDNDFTGGQSTFATLSPITCDTFHHVGNSRINVANTNTGTVTANLSKVVSDYN